MTAGQLTYDLPPRLNGLINRIDGTHRYTVTDHGLRLAIYLNRVYRRLITDGLADLLDTHGLPTPARVHLDGFTNAVDHNIHEYCLIA